jgi:hypothetical protein
MTGSPATATWTRSGGGLVRGDLRIERAGMSGWRLMLRPGGDRHLAELAWGLGRQGLTCATIAEAKSRADAIEAIHLRRMKVHTALFVGLPALALVLVLPTAIGTVFGYAIWVAALALAAEMLLRACEAGLWDEWGWLGHGRSYRTASLLDRFVDRQVVPPSAPQDDQDDRLVRVLD